MCGIVGYVGDEECASLLVDGLRKLEYRGYDSAGVAVLGKEGLSVVRAKGKLANLEKRLGEQMPRGTTGIGHTRWATHGKPSDENAHPHKYGGVAVVHNGIIENHLELKETLSHAGHRFASETDTEIFAHLIADEEKSGKALPDAVRAALAKVKGTYALAVMSERSPEMLVVAKNASPLVVGLGDKCNFVASDVPAILAHTRDVIFLEEGDFAVITKKGVELTDRSGNKLARSVRRIDWTPTMAEKNGHKHFMHKEIHEQARALTDTIRGRASVEEGDVYLDGCKLDGKTISAIAREADDVLYTHAGPEIGVASTKAFTTQLAAFFLLAVRLGRLRGTLDAPAARKHLEALRELPMLVERVLKYEESIRQAAYRFSAARDLLFLGRGPQYPVALEGALKLKEISYIHAEGYAAGEMKHGPIALIDEDMPVMVMAPRDSAAEAGVNYEKILGNIQEVRARGGRVIAIHSEGDMQVPKLAEAAIPVPQSNALLMPIISVIPTQLFAYHVADHRGTDVDQPRNLAKSVTVE